MRIEGWAILGSDSFLTTISDINEFLGQSPWSLVPA